MFQPCVAAAALPPVRVWVGCAALTWVGARPSSYVGAYILPGVAAAALPPVRFWVAVPRVVSAALRVGHCVSLDGLALPMRLRRPFILRRRACPTACCCGAGCPGYGSRRTGVSCWRDGLGPVSFTDVPCPVTEPRVGLFLNWMFALRYALWLNTLAACRAALTPLSSRRGRRRREMRRLSRANNAA